VKAFIDTNVLIYWVDDSARAEVVEQLSLFGIKEPVIFGT
jgi:predicted nucleic acid-binding protein